MKFGTFLPVSNTCLALGFSVLLSACGGGGSGQASTSSAGATPSPEASTFAGAVNSTSSAARARRKPHPSANPITPPQNPPNLTLTTVPSLKDTSQHYVGLNISGLSYYDGMLAMTDIVRESDFRDVSWGSNYAPDVNGAPGTDFLMIITSLTLPSGTYKLQYAGTATVGVTGGSVINSVYDSTHNLTSADVVLPNAVTGNTWLSFSHTHKAQGSAATGLSNIHLWRPGYPTDGSVQFTSEFVQAMKTAQLLRGMDFFSTNGNGSVNWLDRCTMAAVKCAPSVGAPWELMVMLANATGNDIWLNVPVKASDDYIVKLAQLLKYGSNGIQPYTTAQASPLYPPLNASSRVYLEYGNEVWNSGPGFQGFGWALTLAQAAGHDITSPIAYDGLVTDQYQALRRWIAYRSSFISLSFRTVFGDSAMMSQIRPVLASQVGNGNAYFSTELSWADGFYSRQRTVPSNPTVRKVSDIWYGGGGAAYYDSSINPSDTQPATMAAYFANLPSPAFATGTATDATWARAYGLIPIAYEGGPGPGGSALGGISGTPATDYAYNEDPRMKAQMLVAQDIWYQNGGEILSYYGYGVAAPWSFNDGLHPNTVSDTNTVKMQALQAINSRPRAAQTLGTAVPASIFLNTPGNGVQVVSYNSDPALGYRLSASAVDASQSGQLLVPMRAASAGTYKFSVDTAWTPAGGVLELLVNGVSAGTWTTQANSGGALARSAVLTATLPAGLSVVRLRSVSGMYWVANLVVAQ